VAAPRVFFFQSSCDRSLLLSGRAIRWQARHCFGAYGGFLFEAQQVTEPDSDRSFCEMDNWHSGLLEQTHSSLFVASPPVGDVAITEHFFFEPGAHFLFSATHEPCSRRIGCLNIHFSADVYLYITICNLVLLLFDFF